MRIKPITMPIDRDLFGAISRYFNGRSHYEQSPRFHDFRARNDAFDYFQQAIGLGEDFETVRALPITLETMIGFPDTRARHLRELREHTAACARLLSGPSADTVHMTGAALMIQGSSLPLRVEYTAGHESETGLRKTMYLKPFDPMRLLGLEIYTLIGGLESEYNYYFSSGIIVEEAVEGAHEDQLDGLHRRDPTHWRERVKSDLISWFMGLDDLAKVDNYVITPGRRIVFIDFDVMDRAYTPQDLEAIKADTARATAMPRSAYDLLFAYETALLRRRIVQRKDEMGALVRILKSAADTQLRASGEYLSTNLLTLWNVQRLK